MRIELRHFGLIAIIAPLLGCGGDLSDVRGRVSLADKPLTNAIVQFVPVSGPIAQGRLDENGNYKLVTPGKGVGAAPGTYRVYFLQETSEEEEAAKQQLRESDFVAGKRNTLARRPPRSDIPAKFASDKLTDLVCEVTSGSNEFDFDLSKL